MYKNTLENLNEFKKSTNTTLAGKQDTISDLSSIRSGAALGATALQAVPSEYATEEDLGNNVFTPIDSSIVVDVQHAYKIGKLLFIHVIFHRSSSPSETGTYKIGSLSERPLHTHAFPVAGFNENTNNAVSETGAVMTNGDVYVHFTQKTSTSNVKFDLLCIYCEGVLLGIGQGTNIFNLGDTPIEDPEEDANE